MNREEAIKDLKTLKEFFEEQSDAVPLSIEYAIEKLEQEPCEDEYIKVPKKALKYRTAGMVAYNAEWLKNHFDIERTAICGAQEPCDAVSKEAVLNGIFDDEYIKDHINGDVWERIEGIVDALPSVTPAEKVGQWEWVQYDGNPNIGNWHCSECNRIVCGAITAVNPVYSYKYCPQCGCKMQEV